MAPLAPLLAPLEVSLSESVNFLSSHSTPVATPSYNFLRIGSAVRSGWLRASTGFRHLALGRVIEDANGTISLTYCLVRSTSLASGVSHGGVRVHSCCQVTQWQVTTVRQCQPECRASTEYYLILR